MPCMFDSQCIIQCTVHCTMLIVAVSSSMVLFKFHCFAVIFTAVEIAFV